MNPLKQTKNIAEILHKLAWNSDAVENIVSDVIKVKDQFSFFVLQDGVLLQISVTAAGE